MSLVPSLLPPYPLFLSLLLQSYTSPSLSSPPSLIPLFSSSSSNSIHEAFNATHPLHVNLHDPTLLSITAPSTSAPSSPVISLFSSSSFFLPSSPALHPSRSSFTLLLIQSHPSLPLFPSPPPILPFSSSSFSSSNPTHEAFNTAPLHANLYDPILPLHGGSLHVHPFLASDLSFSSSPSFSPPSPPCYTSPSSFPFLLLQSQHSLLLPPPPIPLFPSSSSAFSFKPIHETFNTVLPLHGGSLHPFLAGDPSNMSKSHFHPLK